MSWDFQLAKAAERAFRSLPEKDKARINRALNEMKDNPLSGDVVPLKREYKGLFRRRVGSWRIIFEIDPKNWLVLVHEILRHTSRAGTATCQGAGDFLRKTRTQPPDFGVDRRTSSEETNPRIRPATPAFLLSAGW